jgi:hypothetical protein
MRPAHAALLHPSQKLFRSSQQEKHAQNGLYQLGLHNCSFGCLLCMHIPLLRRRRCSGFTRLSYTTLLMFLVLSCAGGLAAPAIAAGIGAAISMAGGGAAAAAGASGFLATTAGAAAVMSSMGIAGGSYAGAHMARRIGEISPLAQLYK